MTVPYIPNTRKTKDAILKEIGVDSIDDFFRDIPLDYKLDRDLDIPKLSDLDLERYLKDLLSKNSTYTKAISFLGGGVWPHYVPSHIDYLIQRSEFLTSYSPYHPEASQGMLQALFEYQSLVSELTGMEVVNSSTYDWASALGEAALMSVRLTGGKKFFVPEFIAPDRLSVLRSYASGPGLKIELIPQDRKTGLLDITVLENKLDIDTAGVYVENPAYLGTLETEVEEISETVSSKSALFLVGLNPISLGILKPPADYGADIVVGEGQPLGTPADYGGPSLGILACRDRKDFLKHMPGRIVGMTKSIGEGTRGFCLSLQDREQHISREKATSNLCTTQALNAVAAAIYLSSLGPSGLREVAKKCAGNARYMMEKMNDIEGVEAPFFEAPYFNEFVVSFSGADITVEDINSKLLDWGIHGGKPLGEHFPDLENCSLWCTTELHSKDEIDWTVDCLRKILEE